MWARSVLLHDNSGDERSGDSSSDADSDSFLEDQDEESSAGFQRLLISTLTGDGALTFDDVVRGEREFLEGCRRQRAMNDGIFEKDMPRFSVCFSGGGVRAAAFEAGVLWSLAESGALKGCEYLAAVSGGTYISSAFASHLHYAAEDAPPQGDRGLDSWYRLTVAKTICRMQRNIGYMLRDCISSSGIRTSDGSSILPRVCDLPVLLVYFIFTVLFNPAMFFIYIALPTTELLNIMFGFRMRMALCNLRDPDRSQFNFIFQELHTRFASSIIWPVFAILVMAVVINFLFWLLAKCIRPAFLTLHPELISRNGSFHRRRGCAICAANATRMLMRLSLLLFTILAFLAIALLTEAGSEYGLYGSCKDHLEEVMLSSNSQTVSSCLDRLGVGSDPLASNCTSCIHFPLTCPAWCGANLDRDVLLQQVHPLTTVGLESLGYGLLVCLLLATLLVPFFEDIVKRLLLHLGPFLALVILCCLGTYRIFGTVTQQPLHILHSVPFNDEQWDSTVESMLLLAALILPVYKFLESSAHVYYRRSLRKAFFDRGLDRSWGEVANNTFCPFMLFTGTVMDYCNPDFTSPMSEIFFSSLFTGGAKLGYIPTHEWVSLAKCMGLSGAASDAAVLSRVGNYDLRRWWLDLTNLRMGAYMFFERKPGILARLGKHMFEWLKRKGCDAKWTDERFHILADRLPSLLLEECSILLMLFGLNIMKNNQTCELGRNLVLIAYCLHSGMFLLSFFAFLRCLEFTKYSEIISRMHLASGYVMESYTPPRHIYVTDGGVMDALGLLEVLRRRCQRILVVDCTSDEKAQFLHLLRTIQIAEAERLGSFFVASDPELALHTLFDQYRSNPDIKHLHLGIRYDSQLSSGSPCQKEIGHIFVVKPRLSKSLRNSPVKLLTESEICGGEDSGDEAEEDLDLEQSQLGGCWCSCCHQNGCNCNGGPEFPHIPNANQNITPEIFSSLCRLGHFLSKEAVDAVRDPKPLEFDPLSVASLRTFSTSAEDLRRAEARRAELPSSFV